MLQTLLLLFYEFFLTGTFAVGGGIATIPFLQGIGRRRGWYSPEQLGNMIAVSQCVPGPLGTNMAAYVGYAVGALPGAALSVAALMLPTIGVDIVVARLMERFKNNAKMEQAMRAIRPASAGLICAAAFAMLQISLLRAGAAWDWHAPLTWLRVFDWRCAALYAALLPFAFWKKLKKIHPAVYIAIGAAVGAALKL